MIQNKKIIIVFILFIVIPFLVAVINNYMGEVQNNFWSIDNERSVSAAAHILALLGSIVIFIINFKGMKSVAWTVLSVLVVLYSVWALVIIFTFTSFGF